MVRTALVAALLLCAASVSARAQVLVTADRNLQFGQLTPGVAMTVAPTDATRRAGFTISTPGRYQLSFVLPAALSAPGGAQIPLFFAPTDGRVDIRHKLTAFDPAQGTGIHINPADGYGEIFLGGRAQPASGQPSGIYTAVITLIVVQTGT